MTTQKLQQTPKTPVNVPHALGHRWWWLSLGLLLFVATLATTYAVSRPAPALTDTSSPIRAQTVPEAAVQSVTDYLRVHSAGLPSQAVPEAAVQSVTDYLRLHSTDLSTTVITDPAVQSVMDYLRAHGK